MTKSNQSLKISKSSPTIRKPRTKKTSVEEVQKFKCDFCEKEFTRESTLFAHSCERRRRWMDKDEKYVRWGLVTYQKFYCEVMRSKKPKTHEDFINSQYYTAFTKFGRYLLNINAIDPEGFIDHLFKKERIPLDQLCDDKLYAEWVRELTKKESSDRAIERNILLMNQWARENEEPWQDFFRKVSPQLATKWIATGRISPWLLYTTAGQQLLNRMSDEQLTMVKELINPMFWKDKFRDNRSEMDIVEQVLKEAGC